MGSAKDYFNKKYEGASDAEVLSETKEAKPDKNGALNSWIKSNGGKQQGETHAEQPETPAQDPPKKEATDADAVDSDEVEESSEFGEKDFKDWKQKIEDTADNVIEDPEGTAEFILMMVDTARLFICPTLAETALFSRHDRETLMRILPDYLKTKAVPLEHVDLIRRYNIQREYMDRLPYTPEQKRMLSKALLKRAKLMKKGSFFEKYDLWIMLIGIELFKFGPVFLGKFQSFMGRSK